MLESIQENFHNAAIQIYRSRELCSFYAEKGGLIIYELSADTSVFAVEES